MKDYNGYIWYVYRDGDFYTVRTMTEKTRIYSAEKLPKTIKKFISDSEKNGCGGNGVWYRWGD